MATPTASPSAPHSSNTTPNSVSPFLRAVLQRDADGEVVAPTNIIVTVASAYQQYQLLRIDHLDRIRLYASIEGMISGNPPFDQAELDNAGLGHKANYNNFRGDSYYERTALMYWNLINSTEVFVKVVLQGNLPNMESYARKIARHFNDVIRLWPDFYTNMGKLGAQLAAYGYCPVVWPDKSSWNWEVVEVSKFFIPNQTSSNISRLTNICVENEYTLQELYKIYLAATDSPDSPWNKDALGSYLIWKANSYVTPLGDAPTGIYDAMQFQRFIQNNDATTMKFYNETVRLVHQFQKEYDLKWSQYIFARDRQGVNTPNSYSYAEDFLYFENRKYDNVTEFLQIFTASPGKFTIHSNIGVAGKIFAQAQTHNVLECAAADLALVAATPLIQSLGTAPNSMGPIRFVPGAATDIGAAQFVRNEMGANIQGLVGAAQFINQNIDMNFNNNGGDPGTPDRNQASVSNTQARFKSYKEFGMLKNNVEHFYTTFDHTVQQMFVRFLFSKTSDPLHSYVKEFKSRCLIDGVPEALFDTAQVSDVTGLPIQYKQVRASRVAGDGSTLARIMGLDLLAPITGTFNQEEMAAYKRDVVEAALGVDSVPTYAMSDSQNDEVSGGVSLAAMENFAMGQGGQAVFSPDNEHPTHAKMHLSMAMQQVQMMQQQQTDAVRITEIFELLIPHTAEHIQAMQAAPQFYGQTLNEVMPAFNQIIKLAQLFKKNATQMQQAAIRKQQDDEAKTQEVMDDAARKDFIAERDMARKDRESEEKMARSRQQSADRGQIMQDRVEMEAENSRQRIENERELEAMRIRNKANSDSERNSNDREAKREKERNAAESPRGMPQAGSAKRRRQDGLRQTPIEEIQETLRGYQGTTPSNIDFE